MVVQVNQFPVTGHPATGHWTWKVQIQGKVDFHRSPVRLYTNLLLVILIPWAWSSLLTEQIWVLNSHSDMKFRTQQIPQSFITPGTGL